MNGKGLRYDEAYQDRIRVLSESIREDERADRHERLARFLLHHHVPPVVWNGPRGGGESLRLQSQGERQAELARAIGGYDEAFRLLMSGEGWPGRLPPEWEQQRRALSEKVVEARNRLR